MLRAATPNAKFKILALAAAAMLTACGGGSEPAPQPATPQQAMQMLQAKADQLKAQQVSLSDAATQLMDFAEANLPQFFPGHQSNATLFPFLYRYYPQTNVYLGVSVNGGTQYTESNVYVVGSVFGNSLANPLDVGPLTNYITPTTPGGGGGGGTGNGCFDLALADEQGTVIDVSYQYLGTISGSTRVVTTVGGMTTFEGQSARSTSVVTTGTGGAANFAATGNAYSLREGDNMRHFGSEFTASVGAAGFTTNTTIKSVYNPPYLDSMYTLALGGSTTLTQSGTATSTITVVGFPIPPTVTTTPISGSSTLTYVAREQVTVPAGTFQACKYTTTTSNSSDVSTTWYALPKGIPVKITSNGGAQTIQATSATVKGAPL